MAHVTPEGWYPDPEARGDHRYWDGNSWTAWISRGGTVHNEAATGTAPTATVPTVTGSQVRGGLGGLLFAAQAVAVAGLSGSIGYYAWRRLAVPTRELTEVTTEALSVDPSQMTPTTCAVDGSLGALGCSARAAGLSLLGVLIVAVVLFAFRAPLLALFRKVVDHLPAPTRPVLTAVAAAVIFTMTYANIHPVPELAEGGLVRVEFFPAVIGLVSFLVVALSTTGVRIGRSIFAARDRIPRSLRIALVIAVPLVTGRLMIEQLGGLSNMAQEQIVIGASTLVGALAFIPRRSAEVSL